MTRPVAPWKTLAPAILLIVVCLVTAPAWDAPWLRYVCHGLLAAWLAILATSHVLQHRELLARERLLAHGQALTAARDGRQLLERLVGAIAEEVPQADRCLVHLLSADGSLLLPRYTSLAAGSMHAGIPADRGIAGLALSEGRPIICAGSAQALSTDPQSVSSAGSLVVAPMIIGDERLGIVTLESRRLGAYGNRDTAIVSTLAGFAANALRQARAAEEGSRDSDRLESLTDLLDDGLVLLDGRRCVLRHNSSVARILGAEARDLAGQMVQITSPHVAARRLARLLNQLPDLETAPWERAARIATPVRARVRVLCSPLQQDGQPDAYVLLLRDETRSLDRLSSQSDLAAAAGRELWAAYADLREADVAVAASEPSGLPARTAALAHLRRLATSLADPCVSGAGAEVLVKELTDLGEVLLDVYRQYGLWADTETGVLAIDCPFDLPPLLIDRERVTRALLGLLANVAHRRLPHSEAHLSVKTGENDLTITLRDTGAPIPVSARERLFGTDYVLKDATPDEPAGTGFDIFVCRRILEAHRGQMWMPVMADGSTAFYLLLPRDTSAEA